MFRFLLFGVLLAQLIYSADDVKPGPLVEGEDERALAVAGDLSPAFPDITALEASTAMSDTESPELVQNFRILSVNQI